MAISQKSLNDTLRARYMELVRESLAQLDEELLLVNSNEFAIPCIDGGGNDSFVTIKFSVPTGSRDGDAYDGFALADEYKAKLAEKEKLAKERADAKAKKIARDKANREKLAKSKAEHNA